MKKRLLKRISILCVIAIILSAFSVAVAANDTETTQNVESKFSAKLTEELATLDKNEKTEVMLWMDDIDHNEVNKEVKEKTGDDLETIEIANDNINFNYFLKNSPESLKSNSLDSKINTVADMEKWEKDTKSARKILNTRVDNYIALKREISAREYKKNNANILNELGVNESDVVFSSKYSPLVIVRATADEVTDIVESDSVKEVELSEKLTISNDSDPVYLDQPSNLSKHKEAIDVTSMLQTFSGDGVVIGMLEAAYPNRSDSYLSETTMYVANNHLAPEQVTDQNKIDHATGVARILAGTDGMVPNATLFCTRCNTSPDTFFYAVEYLMDLGSSIINVCIALDRSNETIKEYTLLEKWVDHVVNVENVTFVKSAGNEGGTINVPGLAYNVITVGSINDHLTTSVSDDTFCSWSCSANYGNDGCSKPDIVAPGNNFFGTEGTSFSTPMVTGVIASMMNMAPSVKTKPMVIKAILTASCDRKATGESLGTLTAKQGAGVINYGDAVWMLMNGRYLESTTSVSQHRIHISTELGARRRVALAWIKGNYMGSTDHLNTNNLVNVPYTDLNLSVYTDGNSPVGESDLPNSSVELVNQCSSSANGYYKINVTKNVSTPYGTSYALAWY